MSASAPRRVAVLTLVAVAVTAAVCPLVLPHPASGQSPAPKVVPGTRVFHVPVDAVVVKTDLGQKDGGEFMPMPKQKLFEKPKGPGAPVAAPAFGNAYHVLKGGVASI